MNIKYNYLIGLKIGKVKVISLEMKEKKPILHVNFKCDCGNISSKRIYSFLKCKLNNCGCFLGENLSKYSYNLKAFEKLTPESAYFLGLLYSDGCLVKNRNEVKINLKNDKEILEKLSLYVLNEIKVRKFQNKFNKTCYEFSFCNKQIYNNLLKWGLYPNKSKTLKIHKDLETNSHFWRGMIDGDGCIYFKPPTNNSYSLFNIEICGTFDICESFKLYCSTLVDVSTNVYKYKKLENFGVFRVSGKKSIPILNELYSNNEGLYIERKRNVFNEYIKFLNLNE